MNDIATRKKVKFERLKERITWEKVAAPEHWRPTRKGQELVGYYRGKTALNGAHGEYTAAIVHADGAWYISGARLMRLLDNSGISIGDPVWIVFKGRRALDNDRTMKDFDLYVEKT